MWLGLAGLVFFFGLSTIFVSVVTAVQAWQEHAQAQRPAGGHDADKCGLRRTSSGQREKFYIRCRFAAWPARLEARIDSLLLSSRALSSPTTCRFNPALSG